MALISLSDVSFGYNGNNLLDGVSIAFNDNDHVAIIGDNGSGKTTLLKLLMGRDCSFQGKWLLNSNEIDSKKRWPIIKTFSSYLILVISNKLFKESF